MPVNGRHGHLSARSTDSPAFDSSPLARGRQRASAGRTDPRVGAGGVVSIRLPSPAGGGGHPSLRSAVEADSAAYSQATGARKRFHGGPLCGGELPYRQVSSVGAPITVDSSLTVHYSKSRVGFCFRFRGCFFSLSCHVWPVEDRVALTLIAESFGSLSHWARSPCLR